VNATQTIRDCFPRSLLWIGIASILLRGDPVPAAEAAKQAPKQAATTVATPEDLPQIRALEKQVEGLAARVLPATVGIRSGSAQGSGVIVTRDGYVATAGHLITKPGQEVTIVMPDGKTHKGVTLGFDRILDSGLVKITDAGSWPFLEMGDSGTVREGAWCVAIGHPLGIQEGRPPVVRFGRVLSTSDQIFRTDCSIVAGDSGGPLLDLDGKVIGINIRIGSLANQNYHVPIHAYRQAWKQLAAGEAIHADLPGKDSREVKTLLRPVVGDAGRQVARVRCDGHDRVLGTIVGPHGWVLTKASELHGKLTCRLRDGRELEARIVGLAPQHDLAMLKLDVAGLSDITWNTKAAVVGQWVISAGMEDDPLAMGVVSVPDRRIGPPRAAMGVKLADMEGMAKIDQVVPRSPAEQSGLKANDVILSFNGKAIGNRVELSSTIKGYRPGQVIKLSVRRGQQKLELSVRLAAGEGLFPRKGDLQNLSGGVSVRHDDFPLVLQHDGAIQPSDCGGPVVDLNGKVIGINIARAGRTETYSLPAEVLLAAMYDLMSGRTAPPDKEKGTGREGEKGRKADSPNDHHPQVFLLAEPLLRYPLLPLSPSLCRFQSPPIGSPTPPATPLVLQRGDVNVLMGDRAQYTRSTLSSLSVKTVWGKPEGRAWIENWRSPADRMAWRVESPKEALYDVDILMAGPADVEVIGPAGSFMLHARAKWNKYAMVGTLALPKGPSTIAVRLHQPADALLKSLELTAAADAKGIRQRVRQFRAPTTWLSQAKYGVMFQWGQWGYPKHGQAKAWPKMIDDFDVPRFVNLVEQTGAGYVIWSATWRTYYFPAPIKAIDHVLPGRTAARDLIGELADALGKKGIRLILYYHEGHPDAEWWKRNWVSTDDKDKFCNNLCAILNEVGLRYGPRLAGWMFDDGMLFYPAPFERIGKAAKAGNPARLISYNPWVLPRLTDFQDFYFGEGFQGNTSTAVGSPGIFTAGAQQGLLAHGSLPLDGPDWGIFKPETKITAPFFAPDHAVAMVQAASAHSQVLSFNLLMYEDGSVSPKSLEVMRSVRKVIRGQ
jgi:S1-C subfamily serine protease